jgi:hypothetical protein
MDTYIVAKLVDKDTGECLGVEKKKVDAFAPFVGMWISDPVWREASNAAGGSPRKVTDVCLYTQREGGPMLVYVEDLKIEKSELDSCLKLHRKKSEWGNDWESGGPGFQRVGF